MTRTLNLVLISVMCPKEWDITLYVLINRKKNSPNLEKTCALMLEDWSGGHGGKEPHCDSWLIARERERETECHYQCVTLKDDLDL